MRSAPSLVVTLTIDELSEIVREAIRRELASKPEQSEWVDTDEAARILDVTPRTVRNYVKHRGLKAERSGPRLIRLRRADVLLFKESA